MIESRKQLIESLSRKENKTVIAIQQFSLKVDELKEAFGDGVELNNLDDLLNKLSEFPAFLEPVKELKEEISKLTFPQIPKAVDIKGLDSLVKSLDEIGKIKAPKLDLSPITTKLQALTKKIGDVTITNRNESDFIPIRRVRRLNNKLIFDDDGWSGGGGGSISTEGLATDRTLQNAPFAVRKTDGFQFLDLQALRTDDTTTADVTYMGKAAIGSATSAAVWQIRSIDQSSGVVITWADGDGEYNNIWDDRASLNYL